MAEHDRINSTTSSEPVSNATVAPDMPPPPRKRKGKKPVTRSQAVQGPVAPTRKWNIVKYQKDNKKYDIYKGDVSASQLFRNLFLTILVELQRDGEDDQE